ncbi:7-cyano-7-deazaguanine synthase [Sinorhizobium meliloti]|uniref:7-cyano-7-deazaguanine synthase n=1 Tax=Rhizobium meliloti TaxID=382 RepID=UPI0004F90D7D|nr:7-cyano-7-deazaguanine synthase [Sinorhizobium meliloti]AIL99949.1 hypothetical protein DU99_11315 [Sinorhizobium meliloti]MDX0298324.1 hypothetical protein [Sinorhizobium meliloti]
MKVVIALSGGLDSTVALYELLAENHRVRAFFVDFAKDSNIRELSAAKKAAIDADIPIEIVDGKGIKEIQIGYVSAEQLASDEMDIKGAEIISGTAISGFTILMTMAQLHAQLINYDQVAFGLISEQTKDRPQVFDLGTKLEEVQSLLNPSAPMVTFNFPFQAMTKPDVVRRGAALGVPFENTWSCLRGDLIHCGACPQCHSRKQSFIAAGVPDPTTYSV